MKAVDAIQYVGSLDHELRSIDIVTLRRSWRALIVDEASDGITLAQLTLALQIVHDRLIAVPHEEAKA